jgi:allophanate hydrolase
MTAPVTPAEPGIPLVVVGAHLSGMPLNSDLREHGASLLYMTTTTDDYRLYALPGGPPRRPGLLRVEAGTGSPIEVEVWSLPPAGFGLFVASIPSPLGIGTLGLADGSAAKGFLVEAIATDGAEDISRFGGWRNYIASLTAPA